MTRKPQPEKYNSQVSFLTTRPMTSAIASAASNRMCSMNSWLRDAVLRKLEAEGHRLPNKSGA
jgi:hypothetical protein